MNDTSTPLDLKSSEKGPVSAVALRRDRRRWAKLLLAISVWTCWPILSYAMLAISSDDVPRWSVSLWVARIGCLCLCIYPLVGIVVGMIMVTAAGRARSWWRMLIGATMFLLLFCLGLGSLLLPVLHPISVAEDVVRVDGRTYALIREWGGEGFIPAQDSDDRPKGTFAVRELGIPGLGYYCPAGRVYLDRPVSMVLPKRLEKKGKGLYPAPSGEVVCVDEEGRGCFVYDPTQRIFYGTLIRRDSAAEIDQCHLLRHVSPFILVGPRDGISQEQVERFRANWMSPGARIAFADVVWHEANHHSNLQVRALVSELLPRPE
jgi:hypothetical protein